VDLTKLETYLRQQAEAWETLAELTGLPWAKEYADKIRAIIVSLFGPATYGATLARHDSGGCPVESAVMAEAASLPAWVVPLLIQLGQELLRKWLSK